MGHVHPSWSPSDVSLRTYLPPQIPHGRETLHLRAPRCAFLLLRSSPPFPRAQMLTTRPLQSVINLSPARTLSPSTCVSNTTSKLALPAAVATASGSVIAKSPLAPPSPP